MIVNELPIEQGNIHSFSSIICSYSSFVNVANYHNKNICEEFAFFKKNGLKIETNIDSITSLKNVTISTKFNDIVIAFLNDYGIDNKSVVFSDFTYFKEYICEQLRFSNPIIIRVNSNLLSYGPINLQNSNRNHTLVISDYNKETQEIFFYDFFIPTYPSKVFFGSMDINDFGEMTIKNGQYNIFKFDSIKLKNVFKAYKKCEFIVDLKNNINTYMENFNRMEVISDTICNLQSRFVKDDILKNSKELVHHIMYRSIVPSRILFRNVCKKYEWNDYYDEFEAIVLEWYKISLLLIKSSFVYTKENYHSVSTRMSSLLLKEKIVLNSMLKHIC